MAESTDERTRIPLEILANLIYLTKQQSRDAQKVEEYMTMADEQVLKLARVLGMVP